MYTFFYESLLAVTHKVYNLLKCGVTKAHIFLKW